MQYPTLLDAIALNSLSSATEHLLLILLILGVVIVINGILTIILYWNKYTYHIKIQELELKHEKIKRYATYQKRRILRDAISMLDPDEKLHLYSIWEDNSIVSRKALFKFNELEDRLKRAERGTELKWAENRINELQKTEDFLFKERTGRKQKK